MQLYSLCAIPVLLVFVFNYIPLFGILIAFKDYRYNLGIFGSKWVGIENFTFFFTSSDFYRITWNTLSMNFVFIVFGTICSVLVATLLFHLRSRNATKVFQTILITPHFLSWVVVAYMAFAFLNPTYGFLNAILGIFGIPAVDWYSEPGAWPYILTFFNIWKHVGMDSVLYYACLMGIDTGLFEAADIDGANSVHKFWKIIVPELTSLLVLQTILKIGGIFRADFGLFYQLPRNIGVLYSTTDVIDTYVFRAMREIGDMSMSSAIGLLQSIVGFILVLTTNFVTNKISPQNALF
ncbi:MAG: sugar ABC transporter permease [Clostridia bacterium]|nr:sugar ABC transporter permease [Clostridia bacterium]MBQ3554136.1 sugar ABC transporter permease [Clostridia bacterium]